MEWKGRFSNQCGNESNPDQTRPVHRLNSIGITCCPHFVYIESSRTAHIIHSKAFLSDSTPGSLNSIKLQSADGRYLKRPCNNAARWCAWADIFVSWKTSSTIQISLKGSMAQWWTQGDYEWKQRPEGKRVKTAGLPCNKKGSRVLKHHVRYGLESLRLGQRGHSRKHKEEPRQQHLALFPFFSCYFLAEGEV